MQRFFSLLVMLIVPLQISWATVEGMYGHLDGKTPEFGFHQHHGKHAHPDNSGEDDHHVTAVITDPGKPSMEMVVKKGEKIEHYKANGSIGSGDGEKAGIAYRMKDGSMVYVPEGKAE